MSRRHQRSEQRADRADSPVLHADVARLIEKGLVKDAFKQAKLCFHQEATAENRVLLERTYLLRIRELIKGGMTSTAREVAGNMLTFGMTDASLFEDLVLVLTQVGLTEKALQFQSRVTSPTAQARLSIRIADRAVIDPAEAPGSMPELRESAQVVRLALMALDADDEAQATELLQGIPRSSLMADWRLFVKGLAAFRKGDAEQSGIAWGRLDPERSASKIAAMLRRTSVAAADAAGPNDFGPLETCAFGEPVLNRLKHLKNAIEANDWKRAIIVLGPLHGSLRRIDPQYSRRLTETLLAPLSNAAANLDFREAQKLIDDVTKQVDPLPWDPHWNRFHALIWEMPQGSPDEALDFWVRYVDDLATLPAGTVQNPQQWQALVYRRIAELNCDCADDIDPHDKGQAPELADYRDRAVAALEQCLRLDPTHRPAYDQLLKLYEESDQPGQWAKAARRLLVAFPNDITMMLVVIHHHQRHDEPDACLEYLERIRVLKPLDTTFDAIEAWAHVAKARHLALKKKWDEGRAEFDRAMELSDDWIPRYRFLSRQAAFEFKANQPKRGEEFVEAAKGLLKEPAPLWLAMTIEAIRYKLSILARSRFDLALEKELTKKTSSATAGELSDILAGYIKSKIDYTRRSHHEQDLITYLRRTSRTKYEEKDLQKVCDFLHCIEDDRELLTNMANRGCKLFPHSPWFAYYRGADQMSRGPFCLNKKQTKLDLERALDLAQKSTDPECQKLLVLIKSSLSRLNDLNEATSHQAHSPFFGGPESESFPRMFERMFEEFGFELPDFNEDFPPRRTPSRKSRKRV